MPEVRLIDANALKREVKTECNPYGKPTIGFDDGCKFMKMIDEQPTIKPEVQCGRWECGGFCSECGLDNEERKTAFCPNCGARMEIV